MKTFGTWAKLYYAAILETDYEMLGRQLDATKDAIDSRLTELQPDHEGTAEEIQAISNALSSLAALRMERERCRGKVA
jgi:hypothetical protein